jgi:hypothetical protein
MITALYIIGGGVIGILVLFIACLLVVAAYDPHEFHD